MPVKSFTRPLNLRRLLREPKREFNLLPFLDLCIIALFFGMHSTRFMFAPGITIDLASAERSSLSGVPTAAVLTVLPAAEVTSVDEKGDAIPPSLRKNPLNRVLFEGEIFTVDILKEKFSAYMQRHNLEQPVLLVKADKGVSVEQLMAIFDNARDSGFYGVQLAAEETTLQDPFLKKLP
ncbi:MAG: biopolymer transporter ExbD [Opitutales bacterium]|nr:biopolymer transporter ExbD [Opitutales bacterium]